MPNFPKPPKLYYYLAGLAIFILILGGTGFYFYQKQNLFSSSNNFTQGNSTKVEEPQKPEPFVGDEISDVIIWQECDLAIRVRKLHPESRIYKYSQESKIYNKQQQPIQEFKEDFLIMNFFVSKSNYQISCYPKQYNKNVSTNYLSTYGKLSKIANPTSQLASQLSFFTDQKKVDIKYNFSGQDNEFPVLSYQINSESPSTSSRDIIDLNVIKDVVSINETEFKDKLQPTTSISTNCTDESNDSRSAEYLKLLGCFLFDQNGIPIYNLTYSSNKAQEIYKNSGYDETKGRTKDYLSGLFGSTEYSPTFGRITSEGQYLSYTYGDSCGSSVYIYEFGFKERKISEIDGGSYSGCAGIDLSGDGNIVDIDCFSKFGNVGQKAKSCFKNTKDFDKYIKEYNQEQTKNDQTRAELAKYLE